jgi:hypothetical protein
MAKKVGKRPDELKAIPSHKASWDYDINQKNGK